MAEERDLFDRVKNIEDKLDELEAWELGSDINSLQDQLVAIRRQITIGRIGTLELHAIRSIHETAHSPRLPHAIGINAEAALNLVQARIADAIRRAEASDAPEEALQNLLSRVNAALKRYNFNEIEVLLQ